MLGSTHLVFLRPLQQRHLAPPDRVPAGADPVWLCVGSNDRVRGVAATAAGCDSFVGPDDPPEDKVKAYQIDTSAQADITQLRIDVNSNDGDITALQDKDTDLQAQITANDGDITALQDKDTDLQGQITANDGDISQNAQDISTNAGHIEDLKADLQALTDRVNEYHPCGAAEPGMYYPDVDEDTYGDSLASFVLCPGPGLVANNLDCDDNDGSSFPGALEVCDGKDNNCNGVTDENQGSTSCGIGECRTTQANCVDGVPQTCQPGTPIAETCNGRDDNCNGATDEGTKACGNVCSGEVALCASCPPKRGNLSACSCKAECDSGPFGSTDCCSSIFGGNYCDPLGCIGRRDLQENSEALPLGKSPYATTGSKQEL